MPDILDHPVFSAVEDATTVIKSDFTVITKIPHRDLSLPVCMVWFIKNSEIVSESWDTIHGLMEICPDNYRRIKGGILLRIEGVEEDILHLEKKIELIRGSLDFLSQNFSKINHPTMALCAAAEGHMFVGYFDRENKNLYRDAVSRYSIALGKTVNAATMDITQGTTVTQIITANDKEKVTERLLCPLEDLKKDLAQCRKMVDLYRENLKVVEVLTKQVG
jgi:hypothetical protein